MHLVEGLILNKIPYKEQDLIVRILQRNGKKLALIAGGARSLKGHKNRSAIELGHMVQFVFPPRKNSHSRTLGYSREWNLQWFPQSLRHDPHGFFLISFFLECLDKLSPEDSQPEQENEEGMNGRSSFAGMFRVASNSLFYLEHSLKEQSFFPALHLFFYLAKLGQELGLYPQISHCMLCQNDLISLFQAPSAQERPIFLYQEGGFACAECFRTKAQLSTQLKRSIDRQDADTDLFLWSLLVLCAQTKYADYATVPVPSGEVLKEMIQYFSFHTHIEPLSLSFLPLGLFPSEQKGPAEGPTEAMPTQES